MEEIKMSGKMVEHKIEPKSQRRRVVEEMAEDFIVSLPKDAPDPFFVHGLRRSAKMLDDLAGDCHIELTTSQLILMGSTVAHLTSSIYRKAPETSIVGVGEQATSFIQRIGNQVADILITNCGCGGK